MYLEVDIRYVVFLVSLCIYDVYRRAFQIHVFWVFRPVFIPEYVLCTWTRATADGQQDTRCIHHIYAHIHVSTQPQVRAYDTCVNTSEYMKYRPSAGCCVCVSQVLDDTDKYSQNTVKYD